MSRALKVGDYCKLSDRGKAIFPYRVRDSLLRITEIGKWPGTRSNMYYLEMVGNPEGEPDPFGGDPAYYRELIKVEKPELPKPRISFKTWIKEQTNA